MIEEIYFKYILALLLFLSAIIRGIYELRYRKFEKVIAYYEDRERFFVVAVGMFLMFPSLIYIFSDFLNFASFREPAYWRITGGVIMFFNVIFFLAIHLFLGKNWSPIIELNKEHTLVTSGPYRYMRHPMYTSIFIHCIALWLLTANHFVGLSALVSFGVIYPFRVKTEEQMMTDQFGEEYKNYMKQTGKLLPKIF